MTDSSNQPESEYKHPWYEYLKRLKAIGSKLVVEDRYSRHCGGKDGFDDFVERWHE